MRVLLRNVLMLAESSWWNGREDVIIGGSHASKLSFMNINCIVMLLTVANTVLSPYGKDLRQCLSENRGELLPTLMRLVACFRVFVMARISTLSARARTPGPHKITHNIWLPWFMDFRARLPAPLVRVGDLARASLPLLSWKGPRNPKRQVLHLPKLQGRPPRRYLELLLLHHGQDQLRRMSLLLLQPLLLCRLCW